MGKRIYLGDSVYVEFDPGGVILTTDNGDGPTNMIILEQSVLAMLISLIRYDSTHPNACRHCSLVLAERGAEHECDGDAAA